MTDSKTCPKCNGMMTQGRIMKHNELSAGNKYMYVFASDEDSGPNLSKMLSGSKRRKALVAFACDDCGFTEFFSHTIE